MTEYTPDDEDIFIAYRFMSLGLMRDPDEKPYDSKATAEADTEYNRWLSAHDDRIRREVMTNLPPHISIVVHQCEAREGGGIYCSREKGHPGDHKILEVPVWSYQDKLNEYLDTYCS